MNRSIFLLASLLILAISIAAQDPELVVQRGHNSQIAGLSFSHDGKYLVSSSIIGDIKIWDAASLQELRNIGGQLAGAKTVEVLPGNRTIFTTSATGAKFWDVSSGKENSSTDVFNSGLIVSADNKKIAVATLAKITIRDMLTGKELIIATSHKQPIALISFSNDSNYLASVSRENEIKLWDAASGAELSFVAADEKRISSIKFSPDSSMLAAASWNGEVRIFHVPSGRQIRTLALPETDSIGDVAFTPDGKFLIVAHWMLGFQRSSAGRMWNIQTGEFVRFFDQLKTPAFALAIAPDGRTVAFGHQDGSISLSSIESGGRLGVFDSSSKFVPAFALSHNAELLVVSAGKNSRIYNLVKGNDVEFLPNARTTHVSKLVFSPDDRYLATAASGNWDSAVDVWDLDERKIVYSIEKQNPMAIAFSPDGRLLAIGGYEKNIEIYDVIGRKHVRSLTGHSEPLNSVKFSADGFRLVSTGHDDTIRVWDLRSGKEKLKISLTGGNMNYAAFSPDGSQIVADRSIDQKVFVWKASDESLVKEYKRDESRLFQTVDAEFPDFYTHHPLTVVSADKRFSVLRGQGSEMLFFDFKSDRQFASLFSMRDSDWALTTPAGYFDGTEYALKKILWRFDNDTFRYAPVEAFFREFYYPRLMQEIMSGRLSLPSKSDLAAIDIRQPSIAIESLDGQKLESQGYGQPSSMTTPFEKREVEVSVKVTDNTSAGRRADREKSGGAVDLRLFRGGSLVKKWTGSVFENTSGCEQLPTKHDEPRKALCKAKITLTAGENQFSAYAFNSQNVKSIDAAAVVKGADSLKKEGTFYILAVGVDKYANTSNNLKYAVADVDKIGAELAAQQVNLKKYAKTEVIKLTNENATRANILLALKRFASGGDASAIPESVRADLSKITKSQPEDAILFHFSGHGTARCQVDAKSNSKNCDRFYLLPHDGFENNYQNAISDEDLEAYFEPIDAGKLLMVIDACNSGQALEAEEKRRGPMNSRGLAQLAYEKGIFILTASQSQQAALETNRLGHGLLTYSLLQGLQKADKSASGEVIDRNWFNYASAEVPKLQLDEMQKRDADNAKTTGTKGPKIFIVNGEDKNLPPEKRGLQSPRLFYRREAEANPFVVAKP